MSRLGTGARTTEPGVSGLAVVAAEGGESGLVPDDGGGGDGDVGLGTLTPMPTPMPTPATSAPAAATSLNSAGLGFHDERWKLFFLRTLASYAARIWAVACAGLM